MIISQAPINMQFQMEFIVSNRPGATRKRGDQFSQRHVGPFHESRLHDAAGGQRFQTSPNELTTAQTNDAVEEGNFPTTTPFTQLSVLQTQIRKPMILPGPRRLVPETEVGRNAVKVLVESIACEYG